MNTQADIEEILRRRHDNGADLWATADRKIMKGSPFTTLDCAGMLVDLGMPPNDPILADTAALIFSTQRPDGRYKVSPEGAIYPCHTIHATRALCQLGYADDARLAPTWRHLLETRHADGGWRCKKFSFGRGPETEASNPGPTLAALDAFRMADHRRTEAELSTAVTFLLSHWTVRQPLGPCHYGIGSRFLQVSYPFAGYNLFFYVYVLSFYALARKDPRFLEALALLQSKLVGGQLVVERQNPGLRALSSYEQGKPCALGTQQYLQILRNMGA